MNKKFQTSSKFKKAILPTLFGALLAFIVGKVFDPIFEYLYTLFLSLGGSFVTYISDSTYRKISDGFTDQTTLYIFNITVIACIYGLTTIFISTKHIFQSNETSAVSSESNHHSEKLEHAMPEDLPQLIEYAEKLKIQLEVQKRQLEKIESRRKRFNNFMDISTRIWIIITIIVLYFNYSSSVFINNKITAMTNNIEIVSPYVSDTEYKKFKSDFHTIQCRRDYEDLEQTLQSIADAHAITLKK